MQKVDGNLWVAPNKALSYPEKYFSDCFKKIGIEFQNNVYVKPCYCLDFLFGNNYYFEVDGEQHYRDPAAIEKDKKRTLLLEKEGYKLIGRCRWKLFSKLNLSEREAYIKQLVSSILNGNTIEFLNKMLNERLEKEEIEQKLIKEKRKEILALKKEEIEQRLIFLKNNIKEFGVTYCANALGISHTQVRRFCLKNNIELPERGKTKPYKAKRLDTLPDGLYFIKNPNMENRYAIDKENNVYTLNGFNSGKIKKNKIYISKKTNRKFVRLLDNSNNKVKLYIDEIII